MYHNTRGRNPSHNNRFRSFNSRPRQVRTVKLFDPSEIVQTTVSAPKIAEEYIPKYTFADFALDERLKRNIRYSIPTPIQDQAIPLILEGKDVIGLANTGTGKTAAFLLPLIDKVLKNHDSRVLIVAPTRELARQIDDEYRLLAQGFGVYSTLCIGGESLHRQRQELYRKPHFVIGTPGRLKDVIQSKSLDISRFNTVVLDEADHMLDIGFLHDIKAIISLLPAQRQSLFFSATMDGKVQEVVQLFVRNPVKISVKTRETSENIEQKIVKVAVRSRKIDQLHDLLNESGYEKVLIFGRTKWGVQKLSDELVKRGFRADAIHGNKRQGQRQRTLDRFKRNEIRILLATDVAARGLDIDNVSHVINYDMPATKDDYVHRIGRTGRASKRGVALTFVE